jgi:hypothetical protein
MDSFQLGLYNAIIDQAKQHGEDSEPDHEVGDLQDSLSACLSIMTLPQTRKLYQVLIDDELIA